jgi:gas vesicle protein
MNATWTHRDDGFVIGLLAGACVGAGLAIWLAPRLAAALRQPVFDSARNLGQRTAEQSQHVGTRVGEAVDKLVRRARGTAAHSGRVIAGGTHSRADLWASTLRAL